MQPSSRAGRSRKQRRLDRVYAIEEKQACRESAGRRRVARITVPRHIGLRRGPDFANSSRFHFAPFQRRPVNHSTGPRIHSAAFHRLNSSKTGEPRRRERESFRQVPSADKSRIRALSKLPPSHRPQIQPDLCRSVRAAGLTPPASPTATALVSPGRQKSRLRGPASRLWPPI